MPHKVNISEKGKTVKLELEDTGVLSGKSIGDAVKGEDVDAKLAGFELEVTGGSDKSGFPMFGEVEGIGLKRVLFKEKGWGMHDARKGIRLRKAVRGRTISADIVQVNLSVTKSGSGKLEELFKADGGSEGENSSSESAEGASDDKEEQPGGDQGGAEGSKGDGAEEKPAEEKKEELKEEKKE
jgi:small subunit ribosomal protein S6e